MTKPIDQISPTGLLQQEETEPVSLSDSERAAIDASKQAAARGEFATDAEVKAIWAKHGL